VAFSPDGSLLASVGWPPDGTTKVWRIPPRESDLLRGHRDGLTALAYSPDGRRLVSGSADGLVKVWGVASTTGGVTEYAREIATLPANVGPVGWLDLAPGGKLLAVGGQARTLTVWDLATSRAVAVLKRQNSRRSPVVFSPDGKTLAYGSDPNTVRLWDVATWHGIAAFQGAPRTADGQPLHVSSLAFSPDGKTLAVGGGRSRSVSLWDIAARREVTGTRGTHDRAVSAVAFSPDGALLVTGGVEGDVKVWNVGSREEVVTLKGHTDEVDWVGFTPDGKTLASSSDDGALRLWNTTSWLEAATLKEPLLNSHAVAFSPKGDALAVGRVDKTIRLLRATPLPEADRQVMLAWHRQSVEEAGGPWQWSAAIQHLSPLIEAEPDQETLRRERGAAYAELGRWREAEADFAKATELAPNKFYAWFCRTLLQLAMGNASGYRRMCAEMVRRFGDAGRPGALNNLNNLAWACVVRPGALNDPGIPVRLAAKAVAGNPGNHTHLNTLGAALCRAGRFEEGIRRLRESIAARKQEDAWDELFLAIASCRLGRRDEARRYLDQATRQIQQLLARKPGDPGGEPLPWHGRLLLSLLQREAEAMFQTQSTAAERRSSAARGAHR
jgi:tetratricopeptide (TPR) repeat protein/glucose/arabinose dehydrogenase